VVSITLVADLTGIVAEIERVHSKWLKCELAQDWSGLLALCSDEIELWPPNSAVVNGREGVSAYLLHGKTRIDKIEVSERRVWAADGLAILTAHFHTTFRLASDENLRTVAGTHLWVLRKLDGKWLVALVVWRC
jgi:ketosteroid isomerase-like protein